MYSDKTYFVSDDDVEYDNTINDITDDDVDDDNIIEENNNIVTNISTRNIGTIFERYLKIPNYLELHPLYQRNICWSSEKMNIFIDTIMRRWLVPNYVIYELTQKEQKKENYYFECIDGQHRLLTIKLYMNNEKIPGTNRYIYWKDKNKLKVFYELHTDILKNIKHARNMTQREKHDFDNFDMIFQTIKCHRGLSYSSKCSIFNRLQNGERVTTYDKLKNIQHPIINCIREQKMVKFLDENKFINKIHFQKSSTALNKCKKPNSLYIFMLIRAFIIIDRKHLGTNYLDLNIKKYIESNTPSVRIDEKTDIIKLHESVKEILTEINNIKINSKIIIEFVYILICIYANYGKLNTIQLINNLIHSK